MNNEFLSKLQSQAWKTMGARYNAARRLRRREVVSSASIAMFSAVSIGLVILQKAYALVPGSSLDNYITALSVLLALFILVVSLVEWGARNGERAAALHSNAEELNAFHRKIEGILAVASGQQVAADRLDDLRIEYERIKERCPYNHDPVDLDRFQAQHWNSPEFAHQKIGIIQKYWIQTRSWFMNLGIFVVFWLAVGTLLFLTPWEDRSRKDSGATAVPPRIDAQEDSTRDDGR